MNESKHKATKADPDLPFKQMDPRQKTVFILKIAACIVTFGFMFPTIMSD
jgi:hypothetical protein